MITIKKKICLEPFINRKYPLIREGVNTSINEDDCPISPIPIEFDEYVNKNDKYGEIDKSFIYLKIYISQTIENIGLFTNEEFIPSDEYINSSPDVFLREAGVGIENYYTYDQHLISGVTESQLDQLATYNQNNPFVEGLNMSNTPSIEFSGVLSITDNSIIYVIGGEVDSSGNYVENTGIVYETYDYTRIVQNNITGVFREIPYTTFKYYNKGIRDYNTTLSGLIHEEKYLNVIEPERIDNEIFIDRGTVNVFEKHLKMSEIDSVGQLERYGQGIFNVKKS